MPLWCVRVSSTNHLSQPIREWTCFKERSVTAKSSEKAKDLKTRQFWLSVRSFSLYIFMFNYKRFLFLTTLLAFLHYTYCYHRQLLPLLFVVLWNQLSLTNESNRFLTHPLSLPLFVCCSSSRYLIALSPYSIVSTFRLTFGSTFLLKELFKGLASYLSCSLQLPETFDISLLFCLYFLFWFFPPIVCDCSHLVPPL